jgi:uncharacterized protein
MQTMKSSSPPRILVTGASGFIGRHLCAALVRQGAHVIVLKHRSRVAAGVTGMPVVDDLSKLPADSRIDAIVNLAGARIVGRLWTARRRDLLLRSRLDTTDALVKLVQRLAIKPAVLVSASAVGFYGVRGAEPLDEQAIGQAVFQSHLCQRWEQAASRVAEYGVRVTTLRLGVVLGRDGGALPPQVFVARLGLGAVLGLGTQGAPWIHIEDAVRLISFALENAGLAGPVNAVSPGHVTQREFQRELARALHRPQWLRVPAAPLRMLLGEMSQLLVDGQHVVPAKALAAGFEFRYPKLDQALGALLLAPAGTSGNKSA